MERKGINQKKKKTERKEAKSLNNKTEINALLLLLLLSLFLLPTFTPLPSHSRPSSFVLLIVHSAVVVGATAAVIVIGLLHKLKYLPWHHQIRFATPHPTTPSTHQPSCTTQHHPPNELQCANIRNRKDKCGESVEKKQQDKTAK